MSARKRKIEKQPAAEIQSRPICTADLRGVLHLLRCGRSVLSATWPSLSPFRRVRPVRRRLLGPARASHCHNQRARWNKRDDRNRFVTTNITRYTHHSYYHYHKCTERRRRAGYSYKTWRGTVRPRGSCSVAPRAAGQGCGEDIRGQMSARFTGLRGVGHACGLLNRRAVHAVSPVRTFFRYSDKFDTDPRPGERRRAAVLCEKHSFRVGRRRRTWRVWGGRVLFS